LPFREEGVVTTFRIGTRGSALALWQANYVADALRDAHPGLSVELVTIRTQGDATQAAGVPLSSFGEKGIFAHEIEAALLAGQIDAAVHSMKDLAHTLPGGLTIAAVPPRAAVADLLIGSRLADLAPGAVVGTGSVRRAALLRERRPRRPDLVTAEIRGNIDTRLRKLAGGGYNAIVLARAGVDRLGLNVEVAEELDPDWFTPDPGQGALAIEARLDDPGTLATLLALNDPKAEHETRAERAFLKAVGGSCKTPIGAWAVETGAGITLRGMVADPATGVVRRDREEGSDPVTVGRRLADRLQGNPNAHV
jgi:hydroxymethylbilane synthase